MKKRIFAGLLPLLLIAALTASAGAAGEKADPLVSLSYLNGEFTQTLKKEGGEEVSKILTPIFDSAMANLSASGYSFAPFFTELYLDVGKTVELRPGASFILTAGSATLSVTSGTVINVSSGKAAASGAALTLMNRYFCVEESSAVVSAAARSLGQVDGYYLTSGVLGGSTRFKDVKILDWYADAVDYVFANGLFTGTSEDMFSPNTAMTRGMFVTVLHRLAGLPASAAASPFNDVADASQYYYKAACWANENGIVAGYGDGTFLPNNQITREQMAVIMYRYAAYSGKDSEPSATVFETFSDKASVSGYAIDAMKWATARGIINGSDGRLMPGSTATRAQVAQIILNFCEKVK